MPTFDGGHYFLTALISIRTDTIKDGESGTSPVHALRKVLDRLPTAAQTLADGHTEANLGPRQDVRRQPIVHEGTQQPFRGSAAQLEARRQAGAGHHVCQRRQSR